MFGLEAIAAIRVLLRRRQYDAAAADGSRWFVARGDSWRHRGSESVLRAAR